MPASQTSTNTDGSDFMINSENFSSHLIKPEEFNDIAGDLNLLKSKAEIWASRVKQWNLLRRDGKITDQRYSHE